jgi:hypothetical protein
MSEPVEYWYRYENRTVSTGWDSDYEVSTGSRVEVSLWKFRVLKHTPKGVWLQRYVVYGDKRFVLRDARKRFACPTIEEALASFIARKDRQIRIHTARLREAEEARTIAQESLDRGEFDELSKKNDLPRRPYYGLDTR